MSGMSKLDLLLLEDMNPNVIAKCRAIVRAEVEHLLDRMLEYPDDYFLDYEGIVYDYAMLAEFLESSWLKETISEAINEEMKSLKIDFNNL
jgi:hypothetical protein